MTDLGHVAVRTNSTYTGLHETLADSSRPLMARVPLRSVGSLDDVADFVTSLGSETVVIFDVDNTLARQGAPLEEFGRSVNGAIDRFEATRGVGRVIALTNGPQRGVPRMISRGNKPWTTRRRLGLREEDRHVVVVGDQIVTDGVLAWRLGGTFLHLVIDDEDEAHRQAMMRRVGRAVSGLFFRRGSVGR
ncbi:MAG: hypothetical protein OES13_12130 [Acidimicrobiia bacterium]|nr:hypothetical protein [Acidimicrobiia bacterium]